MSLSSTTAVKPTFTAPSAATSLTFSLTVNDGTVSSPADTIVVTVTGGGTNVALSATATASSQNTSTGQTAAKAIDGSTAGYPADYTHEWATLGAGAGSWLKLTWATPVTISQVVLFDRPNSDDQITAGTLTFSSGASVAVGTLTNSGAGVTITFSSRTVTSLTLTITKVSATTADVGLAEIRRSRRSYPAARPAGRAARDRRDARLQPAGRPVGQRDRPGWCRRAPTRRSVTLTFVPPHDVLAVRTGIGGECTYRGSSSHQVPHCQDRGLVG